MEHQDAVEKKNGTYWPVLAVAHHYGRGYG